MGTLRPAQKQRDAKTPQVVREIFSRIEKSSGVELPHNGGNINQTATTDAQSTGAGPAGTISDTSMVSEVSDIERPAKISGDALQYRGGFTTFL
jgi:hypothetical protein